jgi:hypothetical protein
MTLFYVYADEHFGWAETASDVLQRAAVSLRGTVRYLSLCNPGCWKRMTTEIRRRKLVAASTETNEKASSRSGQRDYESACASMDLISADTAL